MNAVNFLMYFSLIILSYSCNSSENKFLKIGNDACTMIHVPSFDSLYLNLDSVIHLDGFEVLKPDSSKKYSNLSDPSSIKRVFLKDNIFYTLDMKYMTANAYDFKGRYLNTFNALGSIKGGSLFLLDLFIDDLHNEIYILSNSPNKVMKYSKNGDLIREYIPKFYPSSMSKIQNKYYFDINFNFNKVSGDNNFVITDSAFTISHYGFPYNLKKNNVSSLDNGGIFTINPFEIYYTPGYSNILYTIEDTNIRPYACFKFSNDSSFTNVRNPIFYDSKKDVQLLNHLYVSEGYIGFNYWSNPLQKSFLQLYDLQEKIIYKSKNIDLFSNAFIHQSGSRLLICVNVKDLYYNLTSKIMEQKNYPKWYDELRVRLLSENFNENSIGILIFNILRG